MDTGSLDNSANQGQKPISVSLDHYLVFLSVFTFLSAAILGWGIAPFAGTMAYDLGTGDPERWAFFRPFQTVLGFALASTALWAHFTLLSPYNSAKTFLITGTVFAGSLLIFLISLGAFSDFTTLSYLLQWEISFARTFPEIVSRSSFQLLVLILLGTFMGGCLTFWYSKNTFFGNQSSFLAFEKKSIIPSLVSIVFALVFPVLVAAGALNFAFVVSSGLLMYFVFGIGLVVGAVLTAMIKVSADFNGRRTKITGTIFLLILFGAVGTLWYVSPELLSAVSDIPGFAIALTTLSGLAIGLLGMLFCQCYPVASGKDVSKDQVTRTEDRHPVGFNWPISIGGLVVVALLGLFVPRFLSPGMLIATGDTGLATSIANLRSTNGMKHFVIEKESSDVSSGKVNPLIHFRDANDRMNSVQDSVAVVNCVSMLDQADSKESLKADLENLRDGFASAKLSLRMFCSANDGNGEYFTTASPFMITAPPLNPNDLDKDAFLALLESRVKAAKKYERKKKGEDEEDSPALPRNIKLEHTHIQAGMEDLVGYAEIEYYKCKFDSDFDFKRYLKNRVQHSIHLWDNCEMTEEQWRTVLSIGLQDTVTIIDSGSKFPVAIPAIANMSGSVARLKLSSVRRSENPYRTFVFNAEKKRWIVDGSDGDKKGSSPSNAFPANLKSDYVYTDSKGDVLGIHSAACDWKVETLNNLDPSKLRWLLLNRPKKDNRSSVESMKLLDSGDSSQLETLTVSSLQEDFDKDAFSEKIATSIVAAKKLKTLHLNGSVSSKFLESAANEHVERLIVFRFDDGKTAYPALEKWNGLKELVVINLDKKKTQGGGGMSAVGPERQKYQERHAASYAEEFLKVQPAFIVYVSGFSRPILNSGGWEDYCSRTTLIPCLLANGEDQEDVDGESSN